MNIPSERTQQVNPESATDYCHQLKTEIAPAINDFNTDSDYQ